jgi:hypothetical protein
LDVGASAPNGRHQHGILVGTVRAKNNSFRVVFCPEGQIFCYRFMTVSILKSMTYYIIRTPTVIAIETSDG